MDFEDVLTEIGDYGRYQKQIFWLFVIPNIALYPIYYGSTSIFMVWTPDHWCHVKQLANLSHEVQHRLIRPNKTKQGVAALDSCFMYDINYDDVARTMQLPLLDGQSPESLNKTPCNDGWIYDKTVYDETGATKLDLVCDRAHLVANFFSLPMIGGTIGAPLFGYMSDRFGRRITFTWALVILFSSFVSPAILRDYVSFILFRVILNLSAVCIYNTQSATLMEIVGKSHRSTVSAGVWACYILGASLMPLLAYLTRSWISLHYVTAVAAVYNFVYFFLVPESPRWLISQQRYEEAADILRNIARVNGRTCPSDLVDQLKQVGKSTGTTADSKSNRIWTILWKRSHIRNVFILICIGMCGNATAYYGINLNALNLVGNEFLNTFLLAVVEMPGTLLGWYLMESRLGRRWSLVTLLLMCGIVMCVPAALADDFGSSIGSIAVAIVAKLCVAGSYMIVVQQAMELYATPIRMQLVAMSEMTAGLSNTVTPYITYLGRYGIWIPYAVLGSTCVACGLICSRLPETLNQNLTQTVDEFDAFGRERQFWSLAKSGKEMAERQSCSNEVKLIHVTNGTTADATEDETVA